MAIFAIGRWRKRVLWPAMVSSQMIFVYCFSFARIASVCWTGLIGAAVIATQFCIDLFLGAMGMEIGPDIDIFTAIDILLASFVLMVIAILWASYVVIGYLHAWYAMIIFPAIGSVVFLLDILKHAIEHWLYWYLPSHAESMPNEMKLVAYLRSSRRGRYKFYPVIICDADVVDDPFWPNHTSIVHCVEVRWRSMLWREIVLWRVSLLNGCQWQLASFHIVNPFDPLYPFVGRDHHRFKCFQSLGVIFILEFNAIDSITLTVFDMRFEQVVRYAPTSLLDIDSFDYAFMRLSERLFDDSGQLRGWRIHLYQARFEDDNEPWRVCLRDTVCDLGRVIAVVNYEEIVFGQFSAAEAPTYRTYRTKDGSLFVLVWSSTQSTAMAFNPADNSYRYYATVDEETQLAFSHPRNCYDGPVIMNDRECIVIFPCGCVFLEEFVPATMKYIGAKSFFQSNPGPLNRMTAAEFRQMTGVDMDGQFPAQNSATHHAWIVMPDFSVIASHIAAHL